MDDCPEISKRIIEKGTVSILFRPIIYGSLSYRQEFELRHTVLREPLGMELSEADTRGEEKDLHFGGFRYGLVVCAVVTRKSNKTGHNRQMAVHPEFQGQGIGGEFFEKLCIHLRNIGLQHLWLESRQTAISFYERYEFVCEGDEYMKLGIPHRKMVRSF